MPHPPSCLLRLILTLVAWMGPACMETVGGGTASAAIPAEHEVPKLRRPVALVIADGGRWLYVANRCGSLSIVDTESGNVVNEVVLGRRLADLVVTADGRCLLLVDEAAHELLLVDCQGPSVELVGRIGVSPYPVSVALSGDGKRAFVTSLWSRSLSIVELAADESQRGATRIRDSADRSPLRLTASVPMPFAPRRLLPHPSSDLVLVADAFGGRLAIVDSAARQVVAVRELPAHNMRGLALDASGKKLLVSHQIANSLAQTNANDVHWGVLMTNVVRWLVLDRVLDTNSPILADSHVHQCGDSTGAGGDPAALTVTSAGFVLVPLAGVGKLAGGREDDSALRHVEVGNGPVAVCAHDSIAYVANTFDDTLSVVDLAVMRVRATIVLGPKAPLDLADRGEQLFYDSRLSMDGWFSCHSCHTDGHAAGLVIDNQGDGSFGAAKRVLSLLGTADTGPWAWNGGIHRIEEQIQKSVESTMQGEPLTDQHLAALAAYLNQLESPPPLGPLAGDDPAAVERGRVLFAAQGCAACHEAPSYTSRERYDVGLHDQLGNSLFNPPSLRGVSQGGPYFHDGRAPTLEAVVRDLKHQVHDPLSVDGERDLVAFLRSL